jgi:hypothetical protein
MFKELENVPRRVLTGMVKPDPQAPQAILFSAGPGCKDWTRIPEGVIVDYEFITTVKCDDHDHPVVHLYLRDPTTAEEQAYLLADARSGARALSTAMPGLAASIAPARWDGLGMTGYLSDCVYDASLGYVIRGTTIPCPRA